MGKKRKLLPPIVEQNEGDTAPERPKRTLFGFEDPAPDTFVVPMPPKGEVFRNKEKVMVTCSRRISYRYRHLMLNIVDLLPHCKKDSKVESEASKGAMLNELIELRDCSSCLFFECRKQQDLYLWMVKSPGGPSIKFLVNAVHTMEELKLTGNHLKGSRPILTFTSNFDSQPHWKLVKEMLIQIFGTPKDHRKGKPFHDHVFVFSLLDGHIWFRNYQVSVPHNETAKMEKGAVDDMQLAEVGPRFCLNPITISDGSFGGPLLYRNEKYISPNAIRASEKRKKAEKYKKKIKAKTRRREHEMSNQLEPDEFTGLWKEE